jgi:hypothetical protein
LPTFYLGIADKYGQIVGTSALDKLTVTIDDSGDNKNSTNVYMATVGGQVTYQSDKGTFAIDNL